MAKTKNPRYVSPVGAAGYPYLLKPDTQFNPDGEYKVKLQIPAGEAANKLVSFLDEQFDLAVEKAKEQNQGKKIKAADAPYQVDDETGNVSVNFKLKAKVTPKNGDPFEQRPAVLDAKLKPIPNTTKIGNGSKMKVSDEVVPFFTSLIGAGITLRLKAVQVLELVEFSGGGDFGFEAEDGFEATTTDDNGFSEDDSETDEDF